jgi:hypothetical protein
MQGLLSSLIIATGMMLFTVIVHFFGIVLLLRLISTNNRRVAHLHAIFRQILLLIMAVLGLVFMLTVDIWAYALLYRTLGAIGDFESALYFSTVCFTTLGLGDIVLERGVRLISAIEAANGMILFGWTTAFLISLMGKLRALEHDWLEK